ncbi:MAG: WYL domain-containing protein [Butyrivibrio sp.]|nr:WYL domain-containing protein [Butyrivibrio sp.]
MSKSPDQKLKILYLIKLFYEETDEQHPVTMAEIIAYLASKGIGAERKSIYSDLEALDLMGYEIINRREAPSGYYLASRDFELAELKLLVDAVQSSKFITEKKSMLLIKKIEKLTSRHEGQKLQVQVYVANRVKTDNEAILYNIDYIHEAIAGSRKIEFKYGEWSVERKLVPRGGGAVYTVDPVMLIWDDENYYLVAYDKKSEIIKHFRVDKMLSVKVSAEKRGMNVIMSNFDPAVYAREHFGMFSGEEKTVVVRFPVSLVGVVIDRFGKNVSLKPLAGGDGEFFTARLKVKVSDRFFAWIAGLRGRAVIEGPEEVRDAYSDFISDVAASLEAGR